MEPTNDKLCKCKPGEKHCKKPTTIKQLETRQNFSKMAEDWKKSDKKIPYRTFVKNWYINNKNPK